MFTRLLPFLALAWLFNFGISEERDIGNIDALFEKGVDAFMDERWDECIANFEGALLTIKKSKNGTVDCQRKCNEDVASLTPMMAENIENLHSSEKLVKKSLCFLECSGDFTNYFYSFDKWKSYEYLQHCYFQKTQLQKAASAVYTLLADNPDNKEMLSLLEFYATLPGIDLKGIANLEASPFVAHFRQGLAAYHRKDFAQVIKSMEQSLDEYLLEEEQCRSSCTSEEPALLEWLPEYTSQVVSHIANDLKCKRKCPLTLTTARGDRQEDLLSDHFKYLHFAYFKDGDKRKACESVSSLLLFQPNDTNLMVILTYYKSLVANSTELCKPREAAVNYVTRQNYELQLLKVIAKWSRGTNMDDNIVETDEQTSTVKEKVTTKEHDIQFERLDALDDSAAIDAIRKEFLKDSRLLKSDVELNGPNRILAQGLATEQECQALVELARAAARHGNGFIRNGNRTPYSKREEFQAVSLRRAVLMGHFGIVDQSAVDKLFEIGDRGKAYMEKHFKKKGKLFHEHSNLSCRNPFPVGDNETLPHSHPPHADNCVAHSNGTCTRGDWTNWRDYTSIIYLNDDFIGGEFYFSKNLTEAGITAEVKPRCGQMMGFSSGSENLHAVRGVRSGSRCTFIQLFTLTPSKRDTLRDVAQTARDRSRMKGPLSDAIVKKLDELKEFS